MCVVLKGILPLLEEHRVGSFLASLRIIIHFKLLNLLLKLLEAELGKSEADLS
jgi:hypothetical protein